jgi:hypothetical protein
MLAAGVVHIKQWLNEFAQSVSASAMRRDALLSACSNTSTEPER